MFISSRTPPVPPSSISRFDSNSERSFHTNTSSITPSPSIPKNFSIPFAIQHGYFRCIRYLLELSYDPNERDNQLHTPLILCSYIENDRWSLSLAQNLIEKGAKIALTDHARRNAMHHACALQRIHLVKLYLSCMEFDIGSKDCDGNTYLHYAAITGNCEAAELLIRIADKMGAHLDQCVNREGCSAAVLALRYGHIECANQIIHRDWDEFFVVPRPLSVYETPPMTDINHNLTTASKPKSKISQNSSTNKKDSRPSTLSFGLFKILFNESDKKYFTHLAKLCDEGQQYNRNIRHKNPDISSIINNVNQVKSTVNNHSQKPSAETFLTELQTVKTREEHKISLDKKENTNGLPPRIPVSIQHHVSIKDPRHSSYDRNKSRAHTPVKHQHNSDFVINRCETTTPPSFDSSRRKTNLQRSKTLFPTRNKISNNIDDTNSRKSPSPHKKSRKKSTLNNRPKSASFTSRPQHSNLTFESSTYSKTFFAGRPLSALLQNHHCRSPVQHIIDPSCSIREAKGAASRYNNPEELFGIKPEDLFGTSDNRSKSVTHPDTRLKRNDHPQQEYMYQKDVDKLVDLMTIQQSPSYRQAVTPQPKLQTNDLKSGKEHRRISSSSKLSINSSGTPTNTKRTTLSTLSVCRQLSDKRVTALRSVHT
ncbi:unnamed protein product [Adineta steineri]|uniref:Uncharacterized protein n=1 Tax=Adineta steineri TaxID=433720 RepID=A0A815E4Q2_9BILA|nr:unnamed protein product [Adineta steineri]CAF3710713.1 unnamed protein product [Adineta steineri]